MSENDVMYIKGQLKNVLIALTGDPISNDGGLVRRIEKLETTVESIDKRSRKTSWTVGVLFACAGFILSLIINKK